MIDVLAGLIFLYLFLILLFPEKLGRAYKRWMKEFKKGYEL